MRIRMREGGERERERERGERERKRESGYDSNRPERVYSFSINKKKPSSRPRSQSGHRHWPHTDVMSLVRLLIQFSTDSTYFRIF